MQANHRIIDVTLLNAMKEAEKGSFLKRAPRLTSKVLHPDTFNKMDGKKAEAVKISPRFNGCTLMKVSVFS